MWLRQALQVAKVRQCRRLPHLRQGLLGLSCNASNSSFIQIHPFSRRLVPTRAWAWPVLLPATPGAEAPDRRLLPVIGHQAQARTADAHPIVSSQMGNTRFMGQFQRYNQTWAKKCCKSSGTVLQYPRYFPAISCTLCTYAGIISATQSTVKRRHRNFSNF